MRRFTKRSQRERRHFIIGTFSFSVDAFSLSRFHHKTHPTLIAAFFLLLKPEYVER